MVKINKPISLNGIEHMGLSPGGNLKRVKAILIIAFSINTHTLLHRLNQQIEESKRLYENLGPIYHDIIHAFAAIDAKDTYTKGHSHRVSAYCTAIAEELGWSQRDIEGIRVAGLLHDIGKIAVERSIINKATPLTDEEIRDFRKHPVIGYEILSRARFPWEGILGMVRNHHEKVDGSGYPDGLKGGYIPEGARIMALADAFDAMTTERPYRKRFSLEEALDPVDTRKVSRLLERVTKGMPT